MKNFLIWLVKSTLAATAVVSVWAYSVKSDISTVKKFSSDLKAELKENTENDLKREYQHSEEMKGIQRSLGRIEGALGIPPERSN